MRSATVFRESLDRLVVGFLPDYVTQRLTHSFLSKYSEIMFCGQLLSLRFTTWWRSVTAKWTGNLYTTTNHKPQMVQGLVCRKAHWSYGFRCTFIWYTFPWVIYVKYSSPERGLKDRLSHRKKSSSNWKSRYLHPSVVTAVDNDHSNIVLPIAIITIVYQELLKACFHSPMSIARRWLGWASTISQWSYHT